MCGRYSFAPKKEKIKELLAEVEVPSEIEFRYNIAPTQQAYVVSNDAPHKLQKLQWGLIPHWSHSGMNVGNLINARMEGIEEKPSFREPIQRKRCIVPADSFYEWRKAPGGKKIPYRIFRKNGELLFFAGIWDEWNPGGETKRTFSIITSPPNREMSSLHDRMPVILENAEAREKWLENISLAEVLAMLKPAADGLLEMFQVSGEVNSVANEGPKLHEQVAKQATLFD